MATRRILKMKYDHRELGLLRAYVEVDSRFASSWRLRVETPADIDEFREHLAHGACMTLALVGHHGEWLPGEACVANVSEGFDTATAVTLSGQGPLRRA